MLSTGGFWAVCQMNKNPRCCISESVKLGFHMIVINVLSRKHIGHYGFGFVFLSDSIGNILFR